MFTCMGFKMGYSFIVYLAFLVIRMKMSLFPNILASRVEAEWLYLEYMYVHRENVLHPYSLPSPQCCFRQAAVFCTRTFANYSSKLGLKHFFCALPGIGGR